MKVQCVSPLWMRAPSIGLPLASVTDPEMLLVPGLLVMTSDIQVRIRARTSVTSGWPEGLDELATGVLVSVIHSSVWTCPASQ